MLEKLIHYSLYKFYDLKTYVICQKLIETISNTAWLETYSQMNGFEKTVNIPHEKANKITKHIKSFQYQTDTDPEISCLYRNVECRIQLNDIRKNNLLCWVEYRLLDGSVARDTWFTIGTINLQKSKKGNTFLGFNETKDKPLQKIVNDVDNGEKLNNLLTALKKLIGQAKIGPLHSKSGSRWLNPHWQKKVLRCTFKLLASSTITIDDDRRCK